MRRGSRQQSRFRRAAGAKAKKPKRIQYADDSIAYNTSSKDDFRILLERYHYRSSFPGEVAAAAVRLGKKATKRRSPRRRDCTQDAVLTIDGGDAKDFDDAICVRKQKNGFELDVHIADVSHYVLAGDCIDREAQRRGTSVYLLNKVLPMLPHALSDDLCSLLEGKERNTLSCFMKLSFEGKLTSYRFQPALIRSRKRCTYEEVEAALRGNKPLSNKPLQKSLEAMNELQTILFDRRVREGSLHFEGGDTKVVFAENGVDVLRILAKKRLRSEGLVEECMLLANCAAADFLGLRGGCLYRVHEPPDPEKMEAFKVGLRERGHKLPKEGSPNPLKIAGKNKYQMAIDLAKGSTWERDLLSQLLLKSMQQARYDSNNSGHYGLAFRKYCHFTSPIRRYPDLVVHRLIKQALGEEGRPYPASVLKQLAIEASFKERKAEEAEREFTKVKTIRYVESNRDAEFNGIVIDIEPYGLFVREVGTGIRGLVPQHNLPEDVFFDARRNSFLRKAKGKKKTSSVAYRLGQSIKLELDGVNRKRLFIDFKPSPN